MPSCDRLPSSWTTGGKVHSVLICLVRPFNISLVSVGETDPWYCYERRAANQGKGKRHLAGIIQPGRVRFLAALTECLSSVWVRTMTPFQASTCVLLLWSCEVAMLGRISSSRALLPFRSLSGPAGTERLPSRWGVIISIIDTWLFAEILADKYWFFCVISVLIWLEWLLLGKIIMHLFAFSDTEQ